MSKSTLLIIDGHSMAYRAFYAMPPEAMQTTSGQYTNAVHGFMSMLLRLMDAEQPTHVAVAFDAGRETFRTEEYPLYKAQRDASPEEFRGQVELIRELLDALNIAHLSLPNYEADDILATWATQGERADMTVLVCSGDRDTLQLVDEEVTVLYPIRGVSELARMTPEAVLNKYQVSPQRYPELAALVGEASDNLPGVPGVGPKTAAKWLNSFDGLDNLLAGAADITGKVGQSLRDNLESVIRNRKLNQLVRDLKLPVTATDSVRQVPDRDRVDDICQLLELRTIRRMIEDLLPDDEPSLEVVPSVPITLAAPERVVSWLAENGSDPVGVYATGIWRSGGGDLHSLALAAATGSAIVLDVAQLSSTADAGLAAWLSGASPKVLCAAKPVRLAARNRGWRLEQILDIELAAYLLKPDQRGYELRDLARDYLGREFDDSGDGDQLSLAFDEGMDSASRALTILELAKVLDAELADKQQQSLIDEIEAPVQEVLVDLEIAGIAVDAELLASLRDEFATAVRQAQDSAFAVLGREVNLSSPKQLQGVLFDDFRMPKTRKTATGYTTNAEALDWLYQQTSHPFLEHLLRHRDQVKLLQTVEGLLRSVQDDGRIHTTFLQTVAGTGRLSSADPNLQNIPVRTAVGRKIREVFVAGKDYESLLTADYSQIEMRIMAHASGDETLISAFNSGADFHTVTAAEVFQVLPTEVTSQMRAKIKAMNYGLAYGLGAFGLSQQLKVDQAEARALMDSFYARFGAVQRYLASLVEQARKTGYTETMFGRRRYLPELTSTNRQRREMAERAALNAPIQGSAADIIKIAMLRVAEALKVSGLRSRMLLQVHDELVFEVAPGEEVQLDQLVRREMGSAVQLAVPLEVSVGVGSSWFAAAH